MQSPLRVRRQKREWRRRQESWRQGSAVTAAAKHSSKRVYSLGMYAHQKALGMPKSCAHADQLFYPRSLHNNALQTALTCSSGSRSTGGAAGTNGRRCNSGMASPLF